MVVRNSRNVYVFGELSSLLAHLLIYTPQSRQDFRGTLISLSMNIATAHIARIVCHISVHFLIDLGVTLLSQ